MPDCGVGEVAALHWRLLHFTRAQTQFHVFTHSNDTLYILYWDLQHVLRKCSQGPFVEQTDYKTRL
jgi:hypothetical protein